MGLTGLAIYKNLPKKNCNECGVPTCLAFAMALAAGKASLDACPYVSDEAREALDAASAPPIKLVKVGTGDKVLPVMLLLLLPLLKKPLQKWLLF